MYYAIKSIYPDILDSEFELQDDGTGAFISKWTSAYAQPTPTQLTNAQDAGDIMQAKSSKEAELRTAHEAALASITSFYSPETRDTWFKQEAEARAYLLDNTAPTPYLSTLLTARAIAGEDLLNMSTKIVANADAFATQSAAAEGTLSNRLSALSAATTVAEVEAIVW